MKKIICLLLALICLLCTLAGCQKSTDPMAKSEFRELTVDSKKRVNATVSLDLHTVQAHTGEKVGLYELLPGDDIAAATSREPLDEVRVSQTPEFRFPLYDGDRTRLYSSFAVVFEDGTVLSTDGYYIQNPQSISADTRAFPWSDSPKGLVIDDPDDALSLGAMHVMCEATLSELIGGSETVTLGTLSCSVSADALSRLDNEIGQAAARGIQVSLSLYMDTAISDGAYAAFIDSLVTRYVKDGTCDLTAVFLRTLDTANIATLCRLTDLSLRSRIANGRVYVTPAAATLDEAKIFFSTLQAQLLTGGEMPWGAAVAPQCEITPDQEEPGVLSLSDLPALSEFLFNSQDGSATYFAVCGLSFSASDTDQQAASYALAYRQAISAKAGLVFYGDHVDELTGLRAANGNARRILSVFSSIDKGLSVADRQLCAELLGDEWNSDVADLTSCLTVGGVANVGTSGLEQSVLFDFTTGECYGFEGIGVSAVPKSHHSATWNAPVLYTWVRPDYDNEGGILKHFSDGSALKNVSSLSLQLLCQIPDVENCSAKLTLEGLTANGKRVTYTSDTTIENGKWQTVTFQIGNFVAETDPESPVIMTLTTSADYEIDEDYVLWVKGIDARRHDAGITSYLPLILIGTCLAIGFLAVFLIYRKTKYRRR